MKKYQMLKRFVICSLITVGFFIIIGTKNTNASTVNNYIYNHDISHSRITNDVWSGFPKHAYRHGKDKPEGVVVHETGNPVSTIYNEIAYMKSHYKNAFVHSFVDASRIINIANTKYIAWGVGYPGNARFIQFEQIEVHGKRPFAKEMANSAYYTAYLLNKYNLKPKDASYSGKGTVWSHDSVAKHLGGSDHSDPVEYFKNSGKKYFGHKYTMKQFYQLVKHYYYEVHTNQSKSNNNENINNINQGKNTEDNNSNSNNNESDNNSNNTFDSILSNSQSQTTP